MIKYFHLNMKQHNCF